MRWKIERGNKCASCIQTVRGRLDSARAPSMKSRTGGGVGRRPAIPGPAPVRGGWRVYLSAVNDLSPSGVSWSLRLYGLSSCNTLPTVMGYVSSLVTCLFQ